MRKSGWIILLLTALMACRSHEKEIRTMMSDASNDIVTNREIEGIQLQLMYMPQYWHRMEKHESIVQEADSSEMDFRLTVMLPAGNNVKNANALQYGVDTLFKLVLDQDTLQPVYAEQVQNGRLHGIQYLLGFQRHPLTGVKQGMIVFNDGLFTNHRIVFPLQLQAIIKIDSLSARL